MARKRREKWIVYGEYGGSFTNLTYAKKCAKEASKTPEHNYEAKGITIRENIYYIKAGGSNHE